ncbi:MAG TPA: 4,5-dihydroxyphthalate decarboxylase [Ramlibacter sp.]|uniref:4,5-dihydroxyphthalate decarboxylase n=1 Tax=Ramlibacter sp. TaxID=1917967 RepID=UPI002BF0CB0C|nr:4,5-dihydroxyphthalate decarboxylase [Ramlibacter sp.]HVZ46527.1 4,5-dihydroxyphthalate decarboxylase [Ramlibacter sp.]
MPKLTLSIAVGDYDHTRDLLSGDTTAEGMELVVAKRRPVEEIFHRFTAYREWDISEMSFAKYVALASVPDCDIVAIPVFPSRAFRHSSIYVRQDSELASPSQLRGKCIGVPEWAQTASVYTRGMLSRDYGVPLAEARWVQAGVNQAGRKEKVGLRLPQGVECRSVPDQSLNDLLLRGEVDAVFSARPPAAFLEAKPRLRRMFADSRQEELAYWKRTGIFPIMHVVAVRRAVLDAHPWVAMNLLDAFEEAKRRSLERISDITASTVPLPWIPSYADQAKAILGEDFWPYGIEANRATLDAFLGFAHEQGVCGRLLDAAEIFARTTATRVKV